MDVSPQEKMMVNQLGKNLYLHRLTVGYQQKPEKRGVTNHVLIFDRSGSMHGSLRRLIADLKRWVAGIKIGDWVSIGYFSGEGGQYGFIVRGMEITDRSPAAIARLLEDHETTLSTTCFSEVLSDSISVIYDLCRMSGSSAVNFVFFTDGYPVVRNYNLEVKNTLSALVAAQSIVASALMVGYGDHYNKSLMSTMSQAIGGKLIHADKLESFRERLDETTAGSAAYRVPMSVSIPAYAVFGLTKSGDIILYPTDGKEFQFEVDPEGSQQFVYVVSSVPGDFKDIWLLEHVYAASLALCQVARTDLAMEALSTIGDIALVRKLQSAFTNAEYGQAEQAISEAIYNPGKRFSEGVVLGCLPDRDAFCLLDLIELLESDPDVRFYPKSGYFNYKRIGTKSEQVDNDLKFVTDPGTSVPFSTVWHKTRLNLSLSCNIPGTVQLKDSTKAIALGLPLVVHTNVFRTYTLVKDGLLNVSTLPLSMSENTFNVLQSNGAIDADRQWHKSAVYVVKLDSVPVINRAIADDYLSATVLFDKFDQSLKLAAEINVLKKQRDQLFPKSETDKTAKLLAIYSQEAVDYLGEHGITDSGFRPESTKADPVDWYEAQTIELKADGLMTIPTIEAVKKAIDAGKSLTPAQKVVASAMNIIDQKQAQALPEAVLKMLFDSDIKQRQKQLAACREYIQRAKFAVLLGKRWFSEFASRQDANLTVSGVNYSIKLDTEKVGY